MQGSGKDRAGIVRIEGGGVGRRVEVWKCTDCDGRRREGQRG